MNQTEKLRYECEWSKIDWNTTERAVFKLQKRIYRASLKDNKKGVRHLQRLLLASKQAKLLAVRKVTQDNKGKNTPGVDGVASLTPIQRNKLANSLKLNEKATPIRRVWIDKPGKSEKRPLGIPTISTRAEQTLLKMALEPEWEARFEPDSYGFRPGRSCHDAIRAIYGAAFRKQAYVLDADIAGCFDNINHQQLLKKVDTCPKITRIIKSWLKAGIVDKGFPPKSNESGTPQGSGISPLLANIALHGMEEDTRQYLRHDLMEYCKLHRKGITGKWQDTISIIRYADDFIVIHKCRDIVLKAKVYISQWLGNVGLELKPSKTRLCHTLGQHEGTDPGFNFLGFNIRQYPKTNNRKGYTLMIKPNGDALKRHSLKLKTTIRKMRPVRQEALIKTLNPIISGWANYYQYSASSAAFSKMSTITFRKLWKWALYRHPKKGRKWIKAKYFRTHGKDKWTFKTIQGLVLRKHYEWTFRNYVKVKGTRSPYDGDFIYWATRLGRYATISKRTAELLKRQKGKCGYCKLFFKSDDQIENHHKDKNHNNNAIINLVLLHTHCHHQIHGRGMNDKHQIVEEPDAMKVARPVLKPSAGGDPRT